MKDADATFFIDREQRRLEIETGEFKHSFPLKPIPDELFRVMLQATDFKEESLQAVDDLVNSRIFEAAVATRTFSAVYPINLAIKLTYPTLYDDYIEEIIDDLEGQLLSFQGVPIEKTIGDRLKLFRNLYLDETKIDPYRLGAFEIFGELTFKNLLRDSRASLLFRWFKGRRSKSVQLNCITQIAEERSPFYRFMRVVRSMFATRFLDLLEEKRTCAYEFWITDALTKDLSDRRGFPLMP
ncbi:MAG: hypothetical protein K9W43_10850 [Candidatus Thorarchaeota archaeon]|nr:hypothetical protein [Candidatus Thorarchaeota archaeon]